MANLDALIEAFRIRCRTRAWLYREGEIDLHDAVDLLQAIAAASSLVAEIGQDHVQHLMGEAFAFRDAEKNLDAVADDIVRIAEFLETGHAENSTRRSVLAASTITTAEWLNAHGTTEQISDWLNKHTPRERRELYHHFSRATGSAAA